VRHFASSRFWACLDALPRPVRETAEKNFELLKSDRQHPSLHFKKIGRYYSVRVGKAYRALGVGISEGVLWFWVGSHADYDALIKRK
jgi:hypothetical protein